MRENARHLLLIAGLLAASCGSGDGEDADSTSNPRATIEVTVVPTAAATAATAAQKITRIMRVGTASEVTDAFALDAGLARVTYRYVGPLDATFVARLTDAISGAVVPDVADPLTPSLGETVVMIPRAGASTLDAQLAEGVWQIDIKQPVPGET